MNNNNHINYNRTTSLGQLSGSIFNLLKKELQLQFDNRSIPLKVEYFPIINRLLEQDQVPQQTIAEWFGYDRPRTSRIIDELEKSGFVTRKDDPESRRTKLVCLSDYTKRNEKLIIQAIESSFETAYKGMSKVEIINSIESMKKIKNNLNR
ncbi:MarR family transcriptional regulator [uncultured Aquimarina sp.]|uniref:MarR family winged helix-turn-helix transcriptional regulator n=1 Tax=uncultured Aquimarina sp. TaxID=575652 RepID=UPI00260DC8B5|nr:MarR family transcriptional regulator [uncultured Aquimarina sp.]